MYRILSRIRYLLFLHMCQTYVFLDTTQRHSLSFFWGEEVYIKDIFRIYLTGKHYPCALSTIETVLHSPSFVVEVAITMYDFLKLGDRVWSWIVKMIGWLKENWVKWPVSHPQCTTRDACLGYPHDLKLPQNFQSVLLLLLTKRFSLFLLKPSSDEKKDYVRVRIVHSLVF